MSEILSDKIQAATLRARADGMREMMFRLLIDSSPSSLREAERKEAELRAAADEIERGEL